MTSLPSTDITPTIIEHAGIEFNGHLYISDEHVQLPMGCKELWINAKSSEVDPTLNEFIAKIIHTKDKLGCTYDKKIEELVNKCRKHMYVL